MERGDEVKWKDLTPGNPYVFAFYAGWDAVGTVKRVTPQSVVMSPIYPGIPYSMPDQTLHRYAVKAIYRAKNPETRALAEIAAKGKLPHDITRKIAAHLNPTGEEPKGYPENAFLAARKAKEIARAEVPGPEELAVGRGRRKTRRGGVKGVTAGDLLPGSFYDIYLNEKPSGSATFKRILSHNKYQKTLEFDKFNLPITLGMNARFIPNPNFPRGSEVSWDEIRVGKTYLFETLDGLVTGKVAKKTETSVKVSYMTLGKDEVSHVYLTNPQTRAVSEVAVAEGLPHEIAGKIAALLTGKTPSGYPRDAFLESRQEATKEQEALTATKAGRRKTRRR